MNSLFHERRKFFDGYGGRPGERQAELPPRGVRLTCPCCGFPTLTSSGDYQICELCNWEDDGQDDPNADEVRGGPNHGYSLLEARRNFERYLVMYAPEADTRIGGPDSEREIAIKRTMIDAFEQVMSEPPPDELNRFWEIVREAEQGLGQELKRRVFGPLYKATPCPYCGKPLRTRLAKQCRHCGRDWHED